MPAHPDWRHDHDFGGGSAAGERGTRRVVWITAAMMVVEIAAGWWFNSMALLADGWHMSSHAVAIGLSALAYATARRYARDPRFAFGTWKVEVLGGFASAILLLAVAATMVFGSVERLLAPQPIRYLEAIVVAVVGLVVNAVCALILARAEGHGHGHAHGHGHHHGHAHHHGHLHDHSHDHSYDHSHGHDHGHDQGHGHPPAPGHADLNLRSAYVHVLADAATSVLAIVALLGGWWAGWSWLDPAMGIAGAVLVALWARGLIADTSRILLDREMDHPVVERIRATVAAGSAGATQVTDLHVWRVGPNAYTCALTVVTSDPQLGVAQVRERLLAVGGIAHSTIEIHQEVAQG